MLRVLPPTKKKTPSKLICCKTGSKVGGKTRHSFAAMLIAANRVAGFLLPVLLQPYKKKCYSNPILFFFGAS